MLAGRITSQKIEQTEERNTNIMSSFNKVILMGNLTRDPETRVTPGGLTICKLGLAVNRTFSTQQGEKREEVTYIDCTAFGKQAEALGKWMTKGKPLMIEGRLKLEQWETNDGQKRSKLGVVVETFQFLGDGKAGGSGTDRQATNRPPQDSGDMTGESFDDDPPF